MIAQKLYDAGFTDLVSVMPPDAVIYDKSRVDPSQRGKCPGIKTPGGWVGYSFTKETVNPQKIDSWGANIGLLGDRFPGLDIDVDDEQLSKAVVAQANQFFGDGPLRTSRGARKLIVYRTDEPFARMALKIEYRGTTHTVEVLGKGRQYVVSGTHPSGSEYGWEGRPLWEDGPRYLGTITKEKVSAFFDHLTIALGDRAECRRVGDGKESSENAPPQKELLAPSPEAVAELVASIPNTNNHFPERDDYIRFGHAVKGAGGSLGTYLDWTGRWTDGENDPVITEANWDRMQSPFRVGWAYLQQIAGDLTGYQPAQDIFEVVPGAVPPPETRSFGLGDDIDFSDEWAVAQILDKVKESLRYVSNTGSWYVWTEYRWVSHAGSLEHEIIIRAHLTHLAKWLRTCARACPAKKEGAPFLTAARRFQNAAGIEAVLKLTRGRVSVPLADFDTNPWLLNTPGGVLDLRTGETTPVRKEDLFSRSTSVTPEKGKMPLFSKFMRDLTGGDIDLIRFLQRYMGYCLTGDVSEKVLAFAWGSDSDTGKSTFIRTLSDLFGDYADSVDAEAFITARTGGRVPDDIARLPGARLVTATEPTTGQHWDEKTIKAITGGDEISARKLYKSWFTFKPQFKILMVGNAQPEIRNVDDAMLRRILIVPMNHKVPRKDQIEDLSERMVVEEGPAILHWLVQGCLAWAEVGLGAPEAIRVQTARYKDTQDVMSEWINEQCELGTADSDDPSEYDTSRRELYTAWKIWCRGGDHLAGGEKQFKMNMDAALGLEEVLVGRSRKRGYRGIRLHNMNREEFD